MRPRTRSIRPLFPLIPLLCLIIYSLAPRVVRALELAPGMSSAVLRPEKSDVCKLSGPIVDACCSFEDVQAVNEHVNDQVNDLVKTLFFRYWKVNLWRDCPFWKDGFMCTNRNCAVETADESEIPDEWKSGPLGSVDLSGSSPEMDTVLGGCSFTDKDFCILDNEHSLSDGTCYVDLLKNPERFTGYSGEPANRIWRAIYEENCFNLLGDGTTPLQTEMERAKAVEEACVEKRVFYRLVSGLHSSISVHICNDWLNRTTGEWQPNLDCFVNRVGKFPERVNNVYFNYIVMLRALKKLEPYLKGFTFCTNNQTEDALTRQLLDHVLGSAEGCPTLFEEKQLFLGQDSRKLMREIKGAFRNISRIMDCVSCDKCKMWGKLQVTGLGTALKILFSLDDNWRSWRLTRTEVVTLVNSFQRYSNTLKAIGHFKQMWEERERAHEAEAAEEVKAKKEEAAAKAIAAKAAAAEEAPEEAKPAVQTEPHKDSAKEEQPAAASASSGAKIRREQIAKEKSKQQKFNAQLPKLPFNIPDEWIDILARPGVIFSVLGGMALILIIALVFWLEPEAETDKRLALQKQVAERRKAKKVS